MATPVDWRELTFYTEPQTKLHEYVIAWEFQRSENLVAVILLCIDYNAVYYENRILI